MLLTIVVFVAILGVIVLVHEAGHFVTARRAGVKVEEFGLGLPPRAFGLFKDENGKWQRIGIKTKEAPKTIWSLNWIPLGGFVKIKGEEGGDQNDPTSFGSKSVLQRIWIISAGVTMNIVLAVVILSFGLMVGSPQFVDQENISPLATVSGVEIRVIEVLPNSPAAKAGIEAPDTILAIDGQSFTQVEEIQTYIGSRVGQIVSLDLERDGEVIVLELTPEVLAEIDRGAMGVALVQTGFVSYPWYIAPWFGLVETVKMVGAIIFGFFFIIKTLIVSGELVGEVYGPVGIAGLVGDAARLGFLYVLQFTAVLSVIIAVINFLPFPALDGGRVVFLLIEGIRGRPVNPKFEAMTHNIGFALLMLLVVVVTFNDIARVSSGFLNFTQKVFGLF